MNSPYPFSENNRNNQKPPQKKKLDFKMCKKNTLNSLHDIEYFLKK